MHNHVTMADVAWDAAQTNQHEVKDLKARVAALEKEVSELRRLIQTRLGPQEEVK
jgi:uncharacterized protein YceH (UPF0502 family)